MIFFWNSDFAITSGSSPFYWNGNGGGVDPFPPSPPVTGPDGFWIIRTRRRR